VIDARTLDPQALRRPRAGRAARAGVVARRTKGIAAALQHAAISVAAIATTATTQPGSRLARPATLGIDAAGDPDEHTVVREIDFGSSVGMAATFRCAQITVMQLAAIASSEPRS
jgi:hypothetical protein